VDLGCRTALDSNRGSHRSLAWEVARFLDSARLSVKRETGHGMKLVTALAGAWEDFTLVNKYMVLGGKEQRRAKINIPNPGRRAQRSRGNSNGTSSPEGRRWCGCKGARRGGGRRRGARKARDRRARSTEGSMGAQRGLSEAKVVASAHWEQGLRPACPRARANPPPASSEGFCWASCCSPRAPAIDLLSPGWDSLPCFLSPFADGSSAGYL
jgi:hypothetical protein